MAGVGTKRAELCTVALHDGSMAMKWTDEGQELLKEPVLQAVV